MKRKILIGLSLILGTVLLVSCGISNGNKDSEENKEPIEVKDESFENMLEDEVSSDLIRWLKATTAVDIEARDLDWDIIGGSEADDSDIDEVKDYLRSTMDIHREEKLYEKVEELANMSGESYEKAYYLGTAENILAAGYALDMIDFDEYLEYAVPVAKQIQDNFESWDDYGKNYVLGYMTLSARGQAGNGCDTASRMVAQQKFIAEAEYYYEAYAIDFDMELNEQAYSTYFDDMPKELEPVDLDAKGFEIVKAYIEPVELGINPASGTVQIEGDLYQVPFFIKQMEDNGWEVDSAQKNAPLTTKDTEITLTRDDKTITLEARSPQGETEVSNGMIDTITTSLEGNAEIVFPGELTEGSDVEDFKKVIEESNLGPGKSDFLLEVGLSSDNYNKSSLRIEATTVSVKEISIYVDLFGKEWGLESFYSSLPERYDDYYYEHAKSLRAKTYAFRPEAQDVQESSIELSDNLEDYTFQVGNRVYQLPTTLEELRTGGFDLDVDEDEIVPAGESVKFAGYYFGNEYSKMTFGVINRTEEELAVKDLPVEYVWASIFGFNQYQDYPFIVADGVELDIYNVDDLPDIYGMEGYVSDDEYDDNGVQLNYYVYEFDGGQYTFAYQPGGMISGISINVWPTSE